MSQKVKVKRDRCPECGHPLEEESKKLICRGCGWSESGEERTNEEREFY